MVVDTAATSSNEKTNVDDVVVNPQFYDEVQHTEYPTYNSSKRNKKKACIFALIFVLILALSASTAYFGFKSHQYKELYESTSVRVSGSRFRLNLYKPVVELDTVSLAQWQNTADAIVKNCVAEGQTNLEITGTSEELLGELTEKIGAIDALCLKRQIGALKRN